MEPQEVNNDPIIRLDLVLTYLGILCQPDWCAVSSWRLVPQGLLQHHVKVLQILTDIKRYDLVQEVYLGELCQTWIFLDFLLQDLVKL